MEGLSAKACPSPQELHETAAWIRDELDPFILAGILMSSTCDACRKDHLGKAFFNVSFSQPDYRKKFVNHIVSLFMNGVIQ